MELAELEQTRADSKAHPYDRLVLEWGLVQARAFLRWADGVIKEIEAKALSAR